MTTTIDVTEVVCARCGEPYREWYRPLAGRPALEPCPYCGHDQAADALVYENGVWATPLEDEVRDF